MSLIWNENKLCHLKYTLTSLVRHKATPIEHTNIVVHIDDTKIYGVRRCVNFITIVYLLERVYKIKRFLTHV